MLKANTLSQNATFRWVSNCTNPDTIIHFQHFFQYLSTFYFSSRSVKLRSTLDKPGGVVSLVTNHSTMQQLALDYMVPVAL